VCGFNDSFANYVTIHLHQNNTAIFSMTQSEQLTAPILTGRNVRLSVEMTVDILAICMNARTVKAVGNGCRINSLVASYDYSSVCQINIMRQYLKGDSF